MRPKDALTAGRRGDIALPPPTWTTLRELEPFTSVSAALSWARLRDVRRREPILELEKGTRRVILPGDPHHPDDDGGGFETRFVLLDGRWRPGPIA
jgi:hypothetical protein